MKKDDQFYCARHDSEVRMNELLSLPAMGQEQDWEFELADPAKLDSMMELLENQGLGLEDRSALALITLASLEEALDNDENVDDHVSRLKNYLDRDHLLRQRMKSFWIDLGRATNLEMAKLLLGQ